LNCSVYADEKELNTTEKEEDAIAIPNMK